MATAFKLSWQAGFPVATQPPILKNGHVRTETKLIEQMVELGTKINADDYRINALMS